MAGKSLNFEKKCLKISQIFQVGNLISLEGKAVGR